MVFNNYIPKGSYRDNSKEITLTLAVAKGGSSFSTMVVPDLYNEEHKVDIGYKDGVLQLLNKELSQADIDRLRKKREELGGGEYVPIGSYLDSVDKDRDRFYVQLTAFCSCKDPNRECRFSDLRICRENWDIINDNGILKFKE